MTLVLQHLIAHARALANDGPCVEGHAWSCEGQGGRSCPHEGTERACAYASQAVYVCTRCGEMDYGDAGGPGAADCARGCKR